VTQARLFVLNGLFAMFQLTCCVRLSNIVAFPLNVYSSFSQFHFDSTDLTLAMSCDVMKCVHSLTCDFATN